MKVNLVNNTKKLKELTKKELFLYIILFTVNYCKVKYITFSRIREIYKCIYNENITIKEIERIFFKLLKLHIIKKEKFELISEGIRINEKKNSYS